MKTTLDLTTYTAQELRDLIAAAQAQLNALSQAEPVLTTLEKLFETVIENHGEDNVNYDRRFGHYNGGWTKLVTGINKAQTNGYSILGDWLKHDEPHRFTEGDIVLDCNIGGPRKRPEKVYTLMVFTDGELTIVREIHDDSRAWAVNLWEHIDATLA